MATEAEEVKGACNCSAITVSIPKASWPPACALCHCLNCRASGGSLFTVNMGIPTKEVTITGTPKIYADKDSISGNTVNRHFCGNCGTAIMSVVSEAPDLAYVKGGPFSKLGVAIPPVAVHAFWRRAEKWEAKPEGLAVMD